MYAPQIGLYSPGSGERITTTARVCACVLTSHGRGLCCGPRGVQSQQLRPRRGPNTPTCIGPQQFRQRANADDLLRRHRRRVSKAANSSWCNGLRGVALNGAGGSALSSAARVIDFSRESRGVSDPPQNRETRLHGRREGVAHAPGRCRRSAADGGAQSAPYEPHSVSVLRVTRNSSPCRPFPCPGCCSPWPSSRRATAATARRPSRARVWRCARRRQGRVAALRRRAHARRFGP